MARYPLYVHHEVGAWLGQHRSLERRADWLLAELAARGVAGRPKGVIGPAREVVGLPGHRWRRSGLGGFDYYAWWFEAGEATAFPAGSRVVRAVRHHDLLSPLTLGEPAEYAPRPFEALDPLTDEQAAVVRPGARVRLAVGHPGTGKTGALLYAAIAEVRRSSAARLLYVTLSQGLADDARQFLDGLPELGDRVEVFTYHDLIGEWGAAGSRQATAVIGDEAEEAAFLGFLRDQPRPELNPWQNARGALWAEVRAQLIGRALPFPFEAREQPACERPFLDRETYLRHRQNELGVVPATKAWRLAERFVESRPPGSLHRQAWEVLRRLERGGLDGRLRRFDGLVVDEIQDLTVLQLAVLIEAARRIGATKGGEAVFIAAGDESQVVHPSGFDWGVCKDLLRERLATDPKEFQLVTNQRSPSPLVEAGNRTAALYDELPRAYRPQARVEAETTEATNGRVYVGLVSAGDPNLAPWLEGLLTVPGTALMVCPGVEPAETAPLLAEPRFADLLYGPALVKGLDRQYVVVLDASRALGRLRDDVRAARTGGDRPRYLAARRAIDEFRVAVSRSNETLVLLDRATTERDPLLADLVADGPAEEVSLAHLRYVLETREYDPLERLQELFKEASDLLDLDLPRALRRLDRADGALASLRDADACRQAHRERITARRRAANRLLGAAGEVSGDDPAVRERLAELYDQAAEQFRELERSYGALGDLTRGAQYERLGRRYRETPPGSPDVLPSLPVVLDGYVRVLTELPKRELRAADLRHAREWRDELFGQDWATHVPLEQAVLASDHLAELTGARQDRRAAERLRGELIELLLARARWREALETLERLPEPPPAQLARCHEGLRAWGRAAPLREQAGQLEQALEDYRACGDLPRAAELAERLERADLAGALRLTAELVARLDDLDRRLAPNLSEAERRGLADSLRRAAEKLTSRPQRRPGTAKDRSHLA